MFSRFRKPTRTEQIVGSISSVVGVVVGDKLNKSTKPSRTKKVVAAGSVVTGAAILAGVFAKPKPDSRP